jgi:GTPase
MTPILAIVGRPNVGKSTLFNRLVGKKLAIVHDMPGVTRDRHYAEAHLQGRDLLIVDTGGFDPEDEDPMRQGIARHVRAAIDEADVVLCVLDTLTPPTEADRQAVELLRRANKPVVYFANRSDNAASDLEATELFALGIDPLIIGSALHGRNMARLEAALVQHFAAPELNPEPAVEVPRVALLGKPNAGKSSLLNRLSRSERSLVDDRPGTTRDPVDAEVEYHGKHYLFVDTAGVRRRGKIQDAIEAQSVMRSFRALERSDVVVLMCDCTQGFSDQDARLMALATSRGRAVILGLNKIDLLSRSEQKEMHEKTKTALHYAPWARRIELSAKSGQGITALMEAIDATYDEYTRRIGTGELNRFFSEVIERHPPPTHGGKAPRLYFVTQAETRPPQFVAMCNHPEALTDAYRRFVSNQLRAAFGFESVPIVVRFRPRRRE